MSKTCVERFFPDGEEYRMVRCTHPAKYLVQRNPLINPDWIPMCGVHARRYETKRPIVAEA